jgi:hypothetical protein
MMDHNPICPVCTRDWDERLGYCEGCEKDVVKKKKAKKISKAFVADVFSFRKRSDTPVYDQLTIDFGFAPDQSADWRNMLGGVGLLEDNFS